jgi:hypothetical protein
MSGAPPSSPARGAAAPNGPHTVVTVVDELQQLAADRPEVEFGEIVDTLGSRGFGPLLLALAAVLLLPIGMIPGVGGAVGLVTVAIGVQLLRGRSGLWLPRAVRRRALPAARLDRATRALRPAMLWLRRRLRPRATALAEGAVSLRVMALALVAAGLLMAVFGAIPVLPPLLGVPVLFFALGLTTRDGAAVGLGYLLLAPPVLVAVTG